MKNLNEFPADNEFAEIIKRLRSTRLLSQSLQIRLQNDAASKIEALFSIIDAIYAQGMRDHSTRCKPWWNDLVAIRAGNNG